jgi:hypothetical protein
MACGTPFSGIAPKLVGMEKYFIISLRFESSSKIARWTILASI